MQDRSLEGVFAATRFGRRGERETKREKDRAGRPGSSPLFSLSSIFLLFLPSGRLPPLSLPQDWSLPSSSLAHFLPLSPEENFCSLASKEGRQVSVQSSHPRKLTRATKDR